MVARAVSPARRDRALVFTAAVAVLITTSVTVARQQAGGSRLAVLSIDDLHEGQLETAAAMVLIVITAVLFGRARRIATWRHLMLFTAVATMALDNLGSAALTGSLDSLATDRAATWVSTVVGLLAVLLLSVAAWSPDIPLRDARRSGGAALGGALAVVLGSALVLWLVRGSLPAAFDAPPGVAEDVRFLQAHPAIHAAELVTMCGWLWCTAWFAHLARRTGDELMWWFAMFSTLAGAASLNYFLFPSQLIEMLYLGDYFLLAAVVILLVGSVREIGALEAAHVDRALFEERRRIARAMHDGVAQELALLSSQARHLRHRPEQAGALLRRLEEAAERAMDDTRTAIGTLRGPLRPPVATLVGDAAQVITERAGARLDLVGDGAVDVPADVGALLVRVTQEAVGAAVRTADARVVTVELRQQGETVLRISHDGNAGDAGEQAAAQALASIRERVGHHVGRLEVRRLPAGGLVVEVTIPPDRAATGA